jgi:type IV pilus assembly protein PilQ
MMKTHNLLPTLFATGWLLAFPLFAQEAEMESTDVDRILAELEETPVPEAPAAEVQEPVEVAEEAMAPEEETVVAGDANEVPAISLEEATEVEGLDIESGGEDITQGLISVNYEEVPLADIVKIFAQTSGANIIIPQGLTEPVSGNLNDVFWRDALDVILADKGYALVERTSGIFTINSMENMALEPLATDTLELQYITADAALPAVQSMIVTSNGNVTPIPQTNVLIVNETAQQLQEIKRLIKLVDRPRSQVFIEAKFVELNDSAIQDLGINWSVLQDYSIRATGLTTTYNRTTNRIDQDGQAFIGSSQNFTSRNTGGRESEETNIGTFNQTSSAQTDVLVQGRNFETFDGEEGTIETVPRMQQEVVRSAVLNADEFALTLSALQQLDGVRVVSNPKMLVANGQTANIHVGRNEPNVRALPQGENGNSYVYELDGFIEIGVKLQVTPIINTPKNITINIIPELSRLIDKLVVGAAGTSFPITQIRRIETEFAVESGKTVAIGGLTQSDEAEDVKKVPLLGDLPIIGKYLFSHTSTRMIQDEIIIFVSVDTAHTEKLNDRDGIPNEGKLIHTWLDYQDKDEEAPLRRKAQF